MLKNEKKGNPTKSLKLGFGGNKIKTAAFFLPMTEKYNRMVMQYFKNISNYDLDIKLVCCSDVSTMYSSSINHSRMIISDNSLNRWGLPEKNVISQVGMLNCDAIVDLNPEFNPVHAVLINKVNSSLKIGFESKWSHELFNVTLRDDSHGFIENQYIQINQLLGLL